MKKSLNPTQTHPWSYSLAPLLGSHAPRAAVSTAYFSNAGLNTEGTAPCELLTIAVAKILTRLWLSLSRSRHDLCLYRKLYHHADVWRTGSSAMRSKVTILLKSTNWHSMDDPHTSVLSSVMCHKSPVINASLRYITCRMRMPYLNMSNASLYFLEASATWSKSSYFQFHSLMHRNTSGWW